MALIYRSNHRTGLFTICVFLVENVYTHWSFNEIQNASGNHSSLTPDHLMEEKNYLIAILRRPSVDSYQ